MLDGGEGLDETGVLGVEEGGETAFFSLQLFGKGLQSLGDGGAVHLYLEREVGKREKVGIVE